MQKRARTDDVGFSETSSPKRANSEDPLSDGESSTTNVGLIDPTLVSRGSLLALNEDSTMTSSDCSLSSTRQSSEELRPDEKLQMITNFKKQPLNKGDTWYLVDRKWYRRFAAVFDDPDVTPDMIDALKPIDNSRILDEDDRLKPNLAEGVDVEMVPSTAWDALVSWFGCDQPIQRRIIEGAGVGNERLEFYPPTITVLFVASTSVPVPSNPSFPSLQTPFEVKCSSSIKFKVFSSLVARTHFKIAPKDCRYWKLTANVAVDGSRGPCIDPGEVRKLEPVLVGSGADEGESLESLNVRDKDVLVLEWKNPADPASVWPLASLEKEQEPVPIAVPSRGLFTTPGYVAQLEKANNIPPPVKEEVKKGVFESLQGMLTRSRSGMGSGSTERSKKGVMGLSNLGNTCFMNSAIQCMANTNELNRYFLSEVYKEEINRSNPLGMKGQVASSFGDLVSHLYHGTSSSFSPGEFKRTLARFAPSFSGYQQHDSQEFITFLLDGLHEDLNRIQKKPYVESPDWMGGDEEDLARLAMACWEGYKKRNDSVIVDLFQGQYKSTVQCPQCNKVSVTFDPFMYLTLPLPIKKKFEATVYYIPQDPSAPRYQVDISVPKDSSFKHVKDLLAKWFSVDVKRIVTTELWKGQIYKFWSDHEAISDIASTDIIVFYEVGTNLRSRHDNISVEDENYAVVPVFTGSPVRWGTHQPDAFGAPFFITVTSEQSKDLQLITELVIEQYRRILPHAEAKAFWQTVTLEPEEAKPVVVPLSSTQPEDPVTDITPTEEGEPTAAAVVEQNAEGADGPVVSEATSSTAPDTPMDGSASPALAEPTESEAQPARPTPLFKLLAFTNQWTGNGSRVIPDGKRMNHIRDLHAPVDDDAEGGSSVANQQPLVYPGQGLMCVWSSMEMVHEVFGSDEGSNAFATGYQTFTDPSIVQPDPAVKGRKKAVLSIEDCLDEFSKEETLGEDDLWYCSNCKEHQPATKKLELWKVPDILVVHLKRFGGARNLRDKIDNLIEFPITDFDLENRVQERLVAKTLASSGVDLESLGLETIEEPLLYDLYGVDQHYGGLGGGHYTAVAKNVEDSNWYSFDDSRVSPISDSSIVTPAAYVLFYRRRTTRPIGGNSRVKADKALQEKANATLPPSPTSAPVSALPSLQGDSGRTSPSDGWMSGARTSGMDSYMPGGFPTSTSFSTPSSSGSPSSVGAVTGEINPDPLPPYNPEDGQWNPHSVDSPDWVTGSNSTRPNGIEAEIDDFLATNPASTPVSQTFDSHPSPPASDDGVPLPSSSRPPVDDDYDQLASENNSAQGSASSDDSAVSKSKWVMVEDEPKS